MFYPPGGLPSRSHNYMAHIGRPPGGVKLVNID